MSTSTLNATAGSATANSYATLAEANQYHDDRPAVGTTWEDADDTEKTKALLWATKLLDSNFEWYGLPTDNIQILGWPRTGLTDYNQWNSLSWTTIPREIMWATAELARQLLVEDRAADSDIETLGITSLRAGSIRLAFKENVTAKVIPDVVGRMIPAHWGYVRGTGNRELERC